MPETGRVVAGEIRALLGRQQRSQADLARAIGMSQGTLSSRLRGATEFTIAELAEVARVLEVPLGALLPAGERLNGSTG